MFYNSIFHYYYQEAWTCLTFRSLDLSECQTLIPELIISAVVNVAIFPAIIMRLWFSFRSLFFLYLVYCSNMLTSLCCSLGSAHGSHSKLFFSLEKNVSLINGTNHVSLLSVMAGLPVCFNLNSLIFLRYFDALMQGKQVIYQKIKKGSTFMP